jgi:hypothetical protein
MFAWALLLGLQAAAIRDAVALGAVALPLAPNPYPLLALAPNPYDAPDHGRLVPRRALALAPMPYAGGERRRPATRSGVRPAVLAPSPYEMPFELALAPDPY